MKTLVNGIAAVDSTITNFDGKWWMFLVIQDRNPMENLFLWFADDLLGEWRPHFNNPVKIDVTSARPGGTPFQKEGVLYRPAQDCGKSYGSAIAINRIDEISVRRFRESVVKRIYPCRLSGYQDGFHMISGFRDITVVDGRTYRFVFGEFVHQLKKKLFANRIT